MTHFLLIETSSDVCSVAVANETNTIHLQNDSREHAATLAPMIREAMQQSGLSYSDLSCVGVNGGPGSYTGLRIGLSTAKGICFAANLPLIMVDSLLAYANGLVNGERLGDHEKIIATVDNRRDELFYAVFDSKLNRLQDVTLTVASDEQLHRCLGDSVVVVGSAAEKISRLYPHSPRLRYAHVKPLAVNLLNAVAKEYNEQDFADLAYSEPFYYKDVYIAPKKS